MLGGFPGQDLRSQAPALWTAGTGFSTQSSVAQVFSSQGRPAFLVPSFVRTFAPPNPSLVSSCAIIAPPVASQAGLAINSVFPSISAPILPQPFVVGRGFSPILAKMVGQIVVLDQATESSSSAMLGGFPGFLTKQRNSARSKIRPYSRNYHIITVKS